MRWLASLFEFRDAVCAGLDILFLSVLITESQEIKNLLALIREDIKSCLGQFRSPTLLINRQNALRLRVDEAELGLLRFGPTVQGSEESIEVIENRYQFPAMLFLKMFAPSDKIVQLVD
jgi:hypothetical protein